MTATLGNYQKHIARSTKVSDLTPVLAAKVSEIVANCGAKLISGYRRGARIAGTGRASLHSRYPAEAADLKGNPACIYARLKEWSGGYSTDYRAVQHVHISFASDRRERGARFVHHSGHSRYAYRHSRRHYAQASW